METKRDDAFDPESLEHLYQSLEEMKYLEQALLKVKDRMKYSMLTLPRTTDCDEGWSKVGCQYGTLKRWFGEKGTLLEYLDEIFSLKLESIEKQTDLEYFTDTCDQCGSPYEIAASSQKDVIGKRESIKYSRIRHLAVICPKCSDERRTEDTGQLQLAKQRAQRRLHLQTMPYREYLQTPEWKQIRENMLKHARYMCQVCNAYGVQLNVHHRTYERRGREYHTDLIVLCQECHEIFHTHGKLAQVK